MGIGKDSILTGVKGQAILGEDDFVESLTGYLGRHKDVPEGPKGQRYTTRPALEKIFEGSIVDDRGKRDQMIREAVEKFALLSGPCSTVWDFTLRMCVCE